MATINEDYVSFHTAQFLKEKGFDEETDYIFYHYEEDNDWCFEKFLLEDKFDNKKMLHCPTHQMAMRWLREKHNLFIFPFPQMNTSKFWAEIYQLSDNHEWKNLYCESIDLQDYQTYEEACEAAIKYCLKNLI